MEQNSKLPCNRNNRSPSRVATAACTQAKTPSTQGRVFSVRSDDVVGALDQQLSQIAVASLGDAELRITVSRLAAFRPQAEITTLISTSLEAFLLPERQHIGLLCKVADTVDLDECLRIGVLGLCQLLDGAVILFNLHCHVADLMEQWAKRSCQPRRHHHQAALREA